MSKRNNIQYIKPQDPSFLKRLKEQIGYKEEPTVETKRQRIDFDSDKEDNLSDSNEEQPQVVVLNPGDLTAEQAAKEKLKFEEEELTKPADLNKRILFKKTKKANTLHNNKTDNTIKNKEENNKGIKGNTDKLKNTVKLSFEDNIDELNDTDSN